MTVPPAAVAPGKALGSGAYIVDGISFTLIIGTLAEALPSIAAILAILWTAIRIIETDTVKAMFGNKKDKPNED